MKAPDIPSERSLHGLIKFFFNSLKLKEHKSLLMKIAFIIFIINIKWSYNCQAIILFFSHYLEKTG